jgi:hypothetical protein
MKDLGGLIRLVQWRVDEKRRELGQVQRDLDECNQALVDLGEELKREQEAARSSYEAGQGYANYAKLYLHRREVTLASIRAAEAEVERVREELSGLFLELKQANREKAEAQRLGKLEQSELDEMGISRFQRAKKAADGGEGRG